MNESVSLHEQAVQGIKEIIVNDGITPGDRLPPEDKLVARLGFSRTVVREAVKYLEARGILDVRQGQGTFVRTPDLTPSLDELNLLVRYDKSWLREFVEMRLVLEMGIAEMVIERITEEEMARMSQAILRSRRRVEAGELDIAEEDCEFHIVYLEAAKNRAISGHGMLLRRFFAAPEFRPANQTLEDVQTALDEHIAIHQAILQGDVEQLRAVLRVHLERRLKADAEEQVKDATPNARQGA